MRLIQKFATAAALTTISAAAFAQQSVEPSDKGVVEAPTAGSTSVTLEQVPAEILHSARVALKAFGGHVQLTGAQLDGDGVLAIWEIQAICDGRALEVDVKPDGTIDELEIEIGAGEVPAAVSHAQATLFPGFSSTGVVEKSIRPSALGLPEIWYEFSGEQYDVEIRSDGLAALVEPA